MEPLDIDQEPGSTLIFACHEGYAGSVVYTCGAADGSFSVGTAEASCQPVTCDGTDSEAPAPDNALFSPSETDKTQIPAGRATGQPFDSTLVFQCGAGYVGYVTYTCGAKGFAATQSCEVMTCNGLILYPVGTTNHEARALSTSTALQEEGQPIGSTLVFECSEGYRGLLAFECDTDGRFVTADECDVVTCDGDPSVVQDPVEWDPAIEVSGTAERAPNQPLHSTIVFSCLQVSGTASRPPVTYTCMLDGSFTTYDTCTVVSDCIDNIALLP